MGDVTEISWCDHTRNWWWGCARVSRACRFCYADVLASRWGHTGLWRARGPRRFIGEQTLRSTWKWDAAAAAAGQMALVFASSMSDVFEDHPALPAARARALADVEATRNLLWLLLTKRPENVAGMVPPHWMDGGWPANVWIGTSVELQQFAAPRLDALLALPAAGHFVSAEPLVGPMDLHRWLVGVGGRRLDWVIVGGESGPKAAPMHPAWATHLRDQTVAAGALFHFKQWGRWAPWPADATPVRGRRLRWVPADGSKTTLWTPGSERPDPGAVLMFPATKKATGRLLDGALWNDRPDRPTGAVSEAA